MLNRVALNISSQIMKRASNLQYGQEVYIYGVEIILSTFIEVISVIISSILFSSFIKGLIFIIIFFTFRLFTGGYHAETYKKCFFITLGVFWTVSLSADITSKIFCKKILLDLLFLSLIYIIGRAPVINKNQPLNKEEIIRNLKLTSLFGVGYIFICINLVWENKELLSMVVCTICSVAVLMLITDIIKLKEENNKHGIDY